MEIFICGHAMKKEYGSYCRHIGGAENEQPGYSTSDENPNKCNCWKSDALNFNPKEVI